MKIEFPQSSHDAISAAFADKLQAANQAAFVPSPLHQRVMAQFLDGHHRLTHLISSQEGRLDLCPSVAASAIHELVDMGFMGFSKTANKYALNQKGRAYMAVLNAPPVIGVITPNRTYTNATMRGENLVLKPIQVRDGAYDHKDKKSLGACAPQIKRVTACA